MASWPALRALAGALLTAALASALYLPHLDTPHGPVWDESYYLTTIERQVEHRAQFASHPPLGFLLSSIAPRLGQHRAEAVLAAEKSVAGAAVPKEYDFARARLASALAGVLGAIAFYGLMLTLTDRVGLALTLGNLFTFENAFIVQFRAAQLDSFLMLFSVLALSAFVLAIRRAERNSLVLEATFGAAVGLAAMIKLIGVWAALAGPLLLLARWKAAKRKSWTSRLGDLSRSTVVMLAAFFGTIVLIYAAQTAEGARPPDRATPAGARDLGFISPPHLAWLKGRAAYSPGVVLAAARDDLKYMLSDLGGMPRVDPNGSPPLQWPLMRRTISYRWDSRGSTTGYVQLVGNPVGWALGMVGLLSGPMLVLRAHDTRRRTLALAFLVLWAWVMVLHLWLARTRVMYLYHYFPGLVLSWGLFSLAASEALDRARAKGLNGSTAIATVALLHLAAFCFWSPMTFGRQIDTTTCLARNTLSVHVMCRRDDLDRTGERGTRRRSELRSPRPQLPI